MRIFRTRCLPAGIWRVACRIAGIGLVLIAFTRISAAQSPAALSGYLEHQFAIDRAAGEWTHLDYDRLRIDLKAEAGRRASVSAAFIGQLYRGDTERDLRAYLPASLAAQFDSLTLALSDRMLLNHAFLTVRPGRLEITAGKQFLTWGAAWVFNPTELFRPKNLYEPTYDREGIGAVSVRLPLTTHSDLLVAFVPDGPLGRSGYVARSRHHVSGTDFSLLAATLYDASLPGFRSNRRYTLGGDVSGEALGLGIWLEGTVSSVGERRWLDAVVGANSTVGESTLLLLEIFHNGRGEIAAPYDFRDWSERLAGVTRTMGRWNVYAMATREVGQLWRVGLSMIGNPGDRSGVLIPLISYEFAQDVEILFNALLFGGSDESEYGMDRQGAFLRARVYF